MKRMDSFSVPTKPLVKKGVHGIRVKPVVPKITAYHFTFHAWSGVEGSISASLPGYPEKRYYKYFGRAAFDPVNL